jgi:hypothetical protein
MNWAATTIASAHHRRECPVVHPRGAGAGTDTAISAVVMAVESPLVDESVGGG